MGVRLMGHPIIWCRHHHRALHLNGVVPVIYKKEFFAALVYNLLIGPVGASINHKLVTFSDFIPTKNFKLIVRKVVYANVESFTPFQGRPQCAAAARSSKLPWSAT
jgi:hypothetical protein